jgi:hypothetical protein
MSYGLRGASDELRVASNECQVLETRGAPIRNS